MFAVPSHFFPSLDAATYVTYAVTVFDYAGVGLTDFA